MVLQRTIYGVLAIAVLVLLFLLDVRIAERAEFIGGRWGDLVARGSVLPLFFVLMVLRGAVELTRLLRRRGARPFALFAYLMTTVLLLTPWLSAAGWLGSGPLEVEGLHWQIVWLSATGVGVGVLVVIRRDPDGALRDIGATLVLVFYLGFLSSFGLQLRCGRDIPGQEGAWLLLIVVLTTKASDIGAYFVGSGLGRHKLVPRISPAKSVEGCVGGLIAGSVVAVLFASATTLASGLNAHAETMAALEEITRSFSLRQAPNGISPLVRATIFGLAMAAAGQFGDLVESCFKRDADIKDSGSVVPHYGGILDMIDSPMLAMPVAWVLLTAVWNVV